MIRHPDGWEWLDELPEEWEPPAELNTPTKDPGTNLAIQILASQCVGNDVLELVGEFVTEQARLNLWAAVEGKRFLDTQALLQLSILPDRATEIVYAAWRAYITRMEASRRLAGSADDEYELLLRELGRAVAALTRARTSGGRTLPE